MPYQRGDFIPPISDYSHWNEDAQRVWYEENKYDMQHWDEPVEMDFEGPDDFDPDESVDFDTEEEARQYFNEVSKDYRSSTLHQGINGKWTVELWT